MTGCCPEWLAGMRLSGAREAAREAGFAVIEKETRPPRGVEGRPPARVLRVRRVGPAAIEIVAGYEQHVLRGPEKPPR